MKFSIAAGKASLLATLMGLVVSTAPAFSQVPSTNFLIQRGIGAQNSGNNSSAFNCFTVAANRGDAVGERKLAYCYYAGLGVPKNYSTAFKWFQKSADQGDAIGEYDLATCYQWGEGVVRNLAVALEWFKKSGRAGYAIGAQQVGFCYEIGRGAPKNNTLAMYWYRKAAETGHNQSEYYLAVHYEKGEITPKNDAEAVKWFQKAANAGYERAESKLAFHYEKGLGVGQSIDQAKFWYHKAAKEGNEYALDALKRLEGPPTLVEWVDDDSFEAKVLQAPSPVLVDYYATWCGPCHEYGPIIDKIAQEYQGQLRVVRVNLDDCPKLSKQYNVHSIPYSFLFNQGKLVYSWLGFTDQKDVEFNLQFQLNLKADLTARLLKFFGL